MASPAVCSRCDIEALAFPFFSLALVLFFLKLIFLYEYVCDICNKCLVIICFLVVTPSPRMLTSTSVEEQLSRDLPSCSQWGCLWQRLAQQPPGRSFAPQRLDPPVGSAFVSSLIHTAPVPCTRHLCPLPSLCRPPPPGSC